jgi:DNA recombination protein RmuC
LSKTQKKLSEASNTIDDAAKKTRTIQRKLKDVDDIEGGTNIMIEDGDIDA